MPDNQTSEESSWGNAEMYALDAQLRQLLQASPVPAADQSSILHMLASDVDAVAYAGQEESDDALCGKAGTTP
jgi:hypothetical protein